MKNKNAIKQLKIQIETLKKQKLKLETEDRVTEWSERLGFIPSEGSLFIMDGKEYIIESVEDLFRQITVKQSKDKSLADTRTYVDLTDLRKGVRVITA